MTDVSLQPQASICREIEERSLNAWPALRRVFVDGWILGLSEGYTRRANSVNPIYDGIETVEDRIPMCEELYLTRGLPSIFKVTPKAVEIGLEDALAARSYTKEATTRVQVLTLRAASNGVDRDVEVLDAVDDSWMRAYADLKQMSDAEAFKNRTILDRIGLPIRLVSIKRDDELVASGIAVIESGWVGMFGIVTHPELRRQGYGRRLMTALCEAASKAGAKKAYLQVEADNPAAIALYQSVGFEDVYEYWYRQKQ